MQKDNKEYDLTYTQNRELSWLSFNKRVLEEAADKSVPVMERLKFIEIFSSNLDEFFMVRVGSLLDLSVVKPKDIDNKSGKTPAEQLSDVFEAVKTLMKQRDEIYADVCAELKKYGIEDSNYQSVMSEERKYLCGYYDNYVRPVLSPQIIDKSHPFPHLHNKILYVAAILKNKQNKMLGLIPVPYSVPAIIKLPNSKNRFVRTETLIYENINEIFKIYEVVEKAVISVTRNADISFDDENFDEDNPDYRSYMSKLLKKRDRLAPVRLEVNGTAEMLAGLLKERLGISSNQVFFSQCPLNLRYVYGLKDLPDELYYKKFTPAMPSYIDTEAPIIEQVQMRDVLLLYPFQSMQPFLSLLKEAAHKQSVLSIKITIYRLAPDSEVAKYLCEAAENGKEVTVLVELRARFDEQNNIEWAKKLEQAGCRIIYGMEGFKCHSKICLITMCEKVKFSYITQIGTGNYNEETSELYTDFSLVTADNGIAEDAVMFFQNMLIGNLFGTYKRLLVAPCGMKSSIIKLIDREIEKGRNGRIIIKANSITERELIDKLSEASKAGVSISLIIRGICCLLPGIDKKTDNIKIISIVGRFLEHSRVYAFGTGNESVVYISSADLMTRNQIRRVEIACPVNNIEIKNWILKYLEIVLNDCVKGRELISDRTYIKRFSNNINSQQWFTDHPPDFKKIKLKKK